MSEHASTFSGTRLSTQLRLQLRTKVYPAVDPQCCSGCATLLYAIHEKPLPTDVEAFLKLAGVDLQKPPLVCGIPEEGFLDGCWIIIGELDGGKWDGRAETAFVEPVDGFKFWLAGV